MTATTVPDTASFSVVRAASRGCAPPQAPLIPNPLTGLEVDLLTLCQCGRAATRIILISAGKLATPVTLKNYLTADLDIAGMSLDRYLARLCAEATTVINAPDYAKSTGADPDRRKAAGRARGARTFTATSAPAAAPIPVGAGESQFCASGASNLGPSLNLKLGTA